MELIFNTTKLNQVVIQLKQGRQIIGHESLTISQDFDNMLIKAIDKILGKNKIERLSLKNVEICGKIEDKALWGMILKTIRRALEV